MATKITKEGDTYVYDFNARDTDDVANEQTELSPEEVITLNVVDGEATIEEIEQQIQQVLEEKPAPQIRRRVTRDGGEDKQQG